MGYGTWTVVHLVKFRKQIFYKRSLSKYSKFPINVSETITHIGHHYIVHRSLFTGYSGKVMEKILIT
jgi:hypothetical protein